MFIRRILRDPVLVVLVFVLGAMVYVFATLPQETPRLSSCRYIDPNMSVHVNGAETVYMPTYRGPNIMLTPEMVEQEYQRLAHFRNPRCSPRLEPIDT